MMFLRYSVFVLSLSTVLCLDDYNNNNHNDCTSMVCPSGTTCKMEPKPGYQGDNCAKEPRCVNPCDRVKCTGDTKCVAIYVNCLEGSTDCKPGLQTKCVPKNHYDPCEEYECPKGEGCYLNYTSDGGLYTDGSHQGTPYCQDPCVGVHCENPDEYCYPEEVVCIKAPCNPIATCKKPCDTIECQPGSKCVIPRIGIPCQKPPCRPHPICVAVSNKDN